MAKADRLSPREAGAALAIALLALLGLAPLVSELGLVGVPLVQVGAFAVPAILVAARTGEPMRRLGLVAAPPRALAGALLVGGSFWILVWQLLAPLLVRFGGDESVRELERLILSADVPPIVLIGLLALVPAVCEELLHRGAVARALEPALGRRGAILLSALIFGLAHVSWIRLAPTAALGLVLAYATLASRSLWPAMLLHLTNNASAILFALLGGAEAGPAMRVALTAGAAGATALGLLLLRADPGRESRP